jgi:hypothetical protein
MSSRHYHRVTTNQHRKGGNHQSNSSNEGERSTENNQQQRTHRNKNNNIVRPTVKLKNKDYRGLPLGKRVIDEEKNRLIEEGLRAQRQKVNHEAKEASSGDASTTSIEIQSSSIGQTENSFFYRQIQNFNFFSSSIEKPQLSTHLSSRLIPRTFTNFSSILYQNQLRNSQWKHRLLFKHYDVLAHMTDIHVTRGSNKLISYSFDSFHGLATILSSARSDMISFESIRNKHSYGDICTHYPVELSTIQWNTSVTEDSIAALLPLDKRSLSVVKLDYQNRDVKTIFTTRRISTEINNFFWAQNQPDLLYMLSGNSVYSTRIEHHILNPSTITIGVDIRKEADVVPRGGRFEFSCFNSFWDVGSPSHQEMMLVGARSGQSYLVDPRDKCSLELIKVPYSINDLRYLSQTGSKFVVKDISGNISIFDNRSLRTRSISKAATGKTTIPLNVVKEGNPANIDTTKLWISRDGEIVISAIQSDQNLGIFSTRGDHALIDYVFQSDSCYRKVFNMKKISFSTTSSNSRFHNYDIFSVAALDTVKKEEVILIFEPKQSTVA